MVFLKMENSISTLRLIAGILILHVCSSYSQLLGLPENSRCGNAGGTCRRLRECPIIGNPRQSRPLLCSFVDREPVVCCPPSRAQEMCLMYDRMACNAVDVARRRRAADEFDFDSTKQGVPVDSLVSHIAEEGNNTFTTTRPSTTQRSTSTTRRIYTLSRNGITSTTTRYRQAHSTTTGTTRQTTTTTTTTSTQRPSTTVLPEEHLNETGEDGAATRMLQYGPTLVDNDVEIIDPKVVGGTEARPRELPYMALIGYGTGANREWACGASIVSENFVLSAAHCAQNPTMGPARWARVGELDLSRENSPHQDVAIISRHVHPQYREPAVYNDIALFRLATRLSFSAWVQPICIQVAPTILSERGIAAGWGRTDFVGDTSERLLKVDLRLVDAAQCRTLLGRAGRFLPQGVNLDTMICAGEKEGGKDTCTGDSGGPLVVQGSGQCIRTQIGVVSFGRQCAMPDTPGIYTKVSSFVPWIESIVWPS